MDNKVIDLSDIEGMLSPNFRWLLTDKHLVKVLVGGAGSGKSYSIAITILYKILRDLNTKNHRVLCLRKTQGSARDSIFALFMDLRNKWSLEQYCKVNRTNSTITFVNGSKIMIGGIDDESKLKSIEGLTSIWLEEASEHLKETYMQCNIRLRSNDEEDELPMYLSLNPKSKTCFVYKDFILDKTPGAIVHHSTFMNNSFISASYKEKLEDLARQNKAWYKIYKLGEWLDPEATVFTNWEVIDSVSSKYTQSDKVYGIDWGYTHPSAIISLIKDGDNLFAEELLYMSGKVTSELTAFIKKNLPENAIIYGDSAEPDRITEMRRQNINIRPARKGPDSVRNSIDYLNRHKIFVPKSSENLISELQGYCWKKNKAGDVQDKPIDHHDDAIAALRYAAFSHFAQQRVYKCFY